MGEMPRSGIALYRGGKPPALQGSRKYSVASSGHYCAAPFCIRLAMVVFIFRSSFELAIFFYAFASFSAVSVGRCGPLLLADPQPPPPSVDFCLSRGVSLPSTDPVPYLKQRAVMC